MQGRAHFSPVRKFLLLFLVSAATGGCLTEGAQDDVDATQKIAIDNRVSGSVGDGPIVGATLRTFRNDGTQIAQFQSGSDAGYSVTVSAQSKYYPLKIESSGGTDLVTNLDPDFGLISAVIAPSEQSVANVNPFSTFTVLLAGKLPGRFTVDNLERAQTIVANTLNSGLDSLAQSGPMTTAIDEHNIAEIVKASETLTVAVRRTRNRLRDAGYPMKTDSVIATLASDLVDGVIDGRGASGTDARTAAVMTLVYAQVLIESMANNLHVRGRSAVGAMTEAIHQVLGRSPTITLAELPVTAKMLERSRVGLAAAFDFDARSAISDLREALGDIEAGMDSAEAAALLPVKYRAALGSTIAAVANADRAAIDRVNDIARGISTADPGNHAPDIGGLPPTAVEVGTEYLFAPSATDPNGDLLTFSVGNAPHWASFDSASGRLTGTPSIEDIGDYANVVISVSDGEFSASLAPFSIEVFDGNVAPAISGEPEKVVVAGDGYAFRPTATDANGDTLTFTISNRPYWANFNSATGRLSGEVTESDVGSYDNIVISVTDGNLTDSLPPFQILVESAVPPANTPPTIMGDPPTELNAGSSYSFTPEAGDADGDALTFAIENRPSWTTFDASTGALSGTPGDSDVGVYNNVRISVSDGTDTAAMEFSITVNALSLGAVELTWAPPSQNEDGTPLLDLAGYRIYWGTSSGNYPDSVTIDNPGLTTVLIENLAPGTYEFVATSFNSRGTESAYSNPQTKTVN